jgi:N-methylhydantoinase A
MIKISCETMAQAVKGVVVARARDPRDFVLASFGGAGPMHACFVAQAMSIPQVVIPGAAGVASAFGATAMDMRHDIETFHYAPLETVKTDDLNRLYSMIEKDARERLAEDGIDADAVEMRRTAQMRYVGQTYEVETEIPLGELKQSQVPSIAEAFHSAHEKEYGVSNESFPIAFVSLSVTAVGKMKEPPVYDFSGAEAATSHGSRQVYFDGTWHEADLYDGKNIGPGAKMSGPAVVEYLDSIAVVPPNCNGEVDNSGNLVVNIGN